MVPLWGTQGLKVPLGVMQWGNPINPKSLWWGLCRAQAREEEEEEEEEEKEKGLCLPWSRACSFRGLGR